MPEGDTVWRTARLLDRTLAGRTLTATDFRVPALATVDLAGARVHQTATRGKHLLTHVDSGQQAWTLHSHLKMEGAWQAYGPGQRWRRPTHTVRAVLTSGRRIAVGFSLGVLELLPRGEEASVVGHLGPDLLGPDWDPAEALRRLLDQPDRRLRDALLDQRNLAGIGTMYAAELCFTSGVHPATPVGRVPDLPRLLARAHAMLDLNKERPVQSTTGDLRRGRTHWVFRRDKETCRRCGSRVAVEMLGETGRERASYFCPHCQPPP